MSKLDRNSMIFFASFDGINYEALGKDNDDLSKELNPDTEVGKNVLGEVTVRHNGYEPEVSVDPYYADTDSKLYPKLKQIAQLELYGDADVQGYFIEGSFNKATSGKMTGTGYKRRAYIIPQSIGGDTSGLNITFTVNPIGAIDTVGLEYTIADRGIRIVPNT